MGLFDDISIDIECPVCNEKIDFLLQDVGSTIQCPHCHTDIELQDKGLSKKLEDAENMIDNLFS